MTSPNNIVHAAAIGLRGHKVALVRGADGWVLPSAPVATGQSPELTALRVLEEQTGIPAAVDRLTGVYSDDEGVLVVYSASFDEGETRPGVEFFDGNALPPHIYSSLQVAALADWAASFLQGYTTTRYCPRCGGSRLSMKEKFGRERMTCATCGFIFFRDPKVGAGVFLEQEGRVLLIKRGVNPGMDLWCLPSGFIEHDESPEVAAV